MAVSLIISGVSTLLFYSYAESVGHIDGTPVSDSEYISYFCLNLVGWFAVTRLFFGKDNNDNNGYGGGEYFDCTGGAGGIM